MLAGFDTIILLTGLVEAVALAGVLNLRAPRLNILHAEGRDELEAIDDAQLARARLVGFSTGVIVPPRVLDALGYGAYNFHPGPPHYPGWAPAHFAIHDRAAAFGVTAHEMRADVDAGPIVGVSTILIPRGTTVTKLEELAFSEQVRLFWRLTDALTREEPLPALPLQWGGRTGTRQRFDAMQNVPVTVDKEELERRIAVFGDGTAGGVLEVTLYGHRFRYLQDDKKTAAEAAVVVPFEKLARSA